MIIYLQWDHIMCNACIEMVNKYYDSVDPRLQNILWSPRLRIIYRRRLAWISYYLGMSTHASGEAKFVKKCSMNLRIV